MRKWSSQELVLPCAKFEPTKFDIPFEAELYAGGTVNVKKAKLTGIKCRLDINFDKENNITSVTYTVKQKHKADLRRIIEEKIANANGHNEICEINMVESSLSRLSTITLKYK